MKSSKGLILVAVLFIFFIFSCGKSNNASPSGDNNNSGQTGDSDNDDNNNTGSDDNDGNQDNDGQETPEDNFNPENPISDKTISLDQAIFIDAAKAGSHRSDTQIMDSLIYYLNYAAKGSDVYISIYLLSYQPLIDAIKEAYNNGVNVHMAIDFGRSDSQNENPAAFSALESLFSNPSQIVKINNDASASAIDHEKYVIFSKLYLPRGIAENVIFNTSHNFTLDGTRKVQDAIVMSNESLYNAFLDNWSEVVSRAQSGMKDFNYSVTNIGDSIEAIFFPRRENGEWDGKNTYMDFLDKITDPSTVKIRVAMSDWSRVEEAQKLTALQKAGAQVEVITKDKSGNEVAVAELQNNLAPAGGDVIIVDMSNKNTHSKFMLIQGVIDGEQQEWVLTGSHNFTYNALKVNNETLLFLKNSSLFDQYWEYFDKLKIAMK